MTWVNKLFQRFFRVPRNCGFSPNDSLHNLFRQAELKLVDIGARGGSVPQLIMLAPFSRYYACEPDSEEGQKLQFKLQENIFWREVTVIPEAISSSEGRATLYITKQPGLSSLLQPNDAVVSRYFRGDEFRIRLTTPVSTISLDHAADQYGFRDACFLKVDTQGTELDILRSGKELLKEAVLAVYVEVLFHPFYKGQSQFSDIDSYLRSLGFSLFDLDRSLHRRASFREEFYSRREVVWAHALYMKEPEAIFDKSDVKAFLRASCLLGLTLAFEHYDLALEMVGVGKTAEIFCKAYGNQIREDVEDFVRRRTKKVLRTVRSQKIKPNARSFVYKDRSALYI